MSLVSDTEFVRLFVAAHCEPRGVHRRAQLRRNASAVAHLATAVLSALAVTGVALLLAAV